MQKQKKSLCDKSKKRKAKNKRMISRSGRIFLKIMIKGKTKRLSENRKKSLRVQ